MTIDELLKKKGVKLVEVVENVTEYNNLSLLDVTEDSFTSFTYGDYDFDDADTIREYGEDYHYQIEDVTTGEVVYEYMTEQDVTEFLQDLIQEEKAVDWFEKF